MENETVPGNTAQGVNFTSFFSISNTLDLSSGIERYDSFSTTASNNCGTAVSISGGDGPSSGFANIYLAYDTFLNVPFTDVTNLITGGTDYYNSQFNTITFTGRAFVMTDWDISSGSARCPEHNAARMKLSVGEQSNFIRIEDATDNTEFVLIKAYSDKYF